jgi:hypothetical protein
MAHIELTREKGPSVDGPLQLPMTTMMMMRRRRRRKGKNKGDV